MLRHVEFRAEQPDPGSHQGKLKIDLNCDGKVLLSYDIESASIRAATMQAALRLAMPHVTDAGPSDGATHIVGGAVGGLTLMQAANLVSKNEAKLSDGAMAKLGAIAALVSGFAAGYQTAIQPACDSDEVLDFASRPESWARAKRRVFMDHLYELEKAHGCPGSTPLCNNLNVIYQRALTINVPTTNEDFIDLENQIH